MSYDIHIVELEPQPIAVICERSRPSRLSQVVPALCGEAWEGVKAHPEVQLPGALMMAIYRPEPEHPPADDAEIGLEVGVQVTGPFVGSGRLVAASTPGGRVAVTTHFGPYHRLGEAHQAVRRWCRDNDHEIKGANWEVYGHWTDDESQLRTDVFYLLRP